MILTQPQREALDALFPASATPVQGWFKTWLGLDASALAQPLNALLAQKGALQARLLDAVEQHPLDSAVTFLAGASLAFLRAEQGVNTKINTYTDAFYYISTCASVGYADIFAVTQSGKAIAALVMIVGPALSARSLDRPKGG